MVAYVIADIDIHDHKTYDEYKRQVGADVSGLCRSSDPTWIDTHAVGRISKPRRPLQSAEGEE
jgi:hypothetical protein